uniref:Transmembrane protein 19 n=1 Tax=Strigamia maritima TaxID=126957 RepID=T1JB19_STRMM
MKEARSPFRERSEGIMFLVFLLALILPLSTSFWIFNLILSTANGTVYDPISPVRWLASVLFPIIIAGYGLKKKSLDCSGAIVGGQRNWVQVLCNGGIATELAIIYMIEHGCGETVIDFAKDYHTSWLSMAVLGALACSNGDTWASELGSVIGKGPPVLITSFKPVPRGTNGGVSMAGLLFSALGGSAVGLAYYCALLIFLHPHLLSDSPAQWPVIIVATLSGLIGSLIDSILGATLQYSGVDKKTGKVVDYPGEKVDHVSGMGILDNHSVNLLSSIFTAVITPSLAMSLWQMV